MAVYTGRGEKKLSEKEKAEIITALLNKEKQEYLALHYKVSQPNISFYKRKYATTQSHKAKS
jgi:hypothetical protein